MLAGAPIVKAVGCFILAVASSASATEGFTPAVGLIIKASVKSVKAVSCFIPAVESSMLAVAPIVKAVAFAALAFLSFILKVASRASTTSGPSSSRLIVKAVKAIKKNGPVTINRNRAVFKHLLMITG